MSKVFYEFIYIKKGVNYKLFKILRVKYVLCILINDIKI